MFAQMALVCTDAKKPKDVFKEWMHHPGYRDTLINRSLRTVGLYVEEDIVVMDAIRGLGRAEPGKGGYVIYPNNVRIAVPHQMKVVDLGPELAAVLARNGHPDKEFVGYPISLHHFGNGGVPGNRDSYRCVVSLRGEAVEGVIHVADGGSNRHTSAPGMVVFYPIEPLKKGQQYDVTWTFEHDGGTARNVVKFNT